MIDRDTKKKKGKDEFDSHGVSGGGSGSLSEERSSPHSVLSSEVVKALTSEIISDRPMPSSPSPHLTPPTKQPPLVREASGLKKPSLSVATSTKRFSEESIKTTPTGSSSGGGVNSTSLRKKTDSPLVSSRSAAIPTEAAGGSELDSFLKRKKESSTGGKVKPTIR
jgi:hypothetical protein